MVNNTYIDLSKLATPPNITIEITPTWGWVDDGIKTVFGQFSWLFMVESIGVFIIFFILFYKQDYLTFSTSQNVLASAFIVMFFNLGMLYADYFTSFIPLGLFFVIWLGALITTIKDN